MNRKRVTRMLLGYGWMIERYFTNLERGSGIRADLVFTKASQIIQSIKGGEILYIHTYMVANCLRVHIHMYLPCVYRHLL